MKFIVLHYHLRPSGIRRIIELATPYLIQAMSRRPKTVVLATGEAPDPAWLKAFRASLKGYRLKVFVEPAFGYLSEQRRRPETITRRVREALHGLLQDGAGDLLWAHNLGIARNIILSRELGRACAQQQVRYVVHHHDWWFDNRWPRWPEMNQFGFRTLKSAARAIIPNEGDVRHVAINHFDASILHNHLGAASGWLPNLTERHPPPKPHRCRAASKWLQQKLGDHGAPVWILPSRLLRRKNIAEALLLKRWLRPEAWLVVTGTASSADEKPYHAQLSKAAREHHWRLRLGIMEGDESGMPAMTELLAVSEAVLLTSVQEGFGLTYLEAAAAHRPLIARRIPNIAPDLKKFGFQFPQYYKEVLVDPRLFNWNAECRRQARLFARWKRQLPGSCRRLAGVPVVLAATAPCPVPFSRLTLDAQLEVLAQPVRESWEACAPLNPFLRTWRRRAMAGKLKPTTWPSRARQWLSGPSFAAHFHRILDTTGKLPRPHNGTAEAIQGEFISKKLTGSNLFPLLWSDKP